MSSQPETERPHVPDHEMLARVGRGSYGEVWLARNVMGSFRAIKVVFRASFDSDRPYEREFSGLQKFEPVSRTHPGFVALLHMGRNVEAGYFYCVMEVADDVAAGPAIDPANYRPRTLAADLAKHGRLPLEECLELGIALAAALGHLHSRGLVHRDIKPANIIFVNTVPKLADIGLVTQIGSQATFVGTDGYIPPEGPGSPGADLYSLGKLLYEVSMGKSQDQFPELPTRLRELPEAVELMRLNAVVLKACEHQPAKRFRSAEDLGAALTKLRHELAGRSKKGAGARGDRSVAGLKALIFAPSADPGDVALARLLAERLAEEGFVVSSDAQPTLSVEWARRIEHQIREAQVFIPILTASSVHTELMAYALEIAQQASRRTSGLPRMVPVRLQIPEELPRQIRFALDGASPVVIDKAATPSQVLESVLENIRAGALADQKR